MPCHRDPDIDGTIGRARQLVETVRNKAEAVHRVAQAVVDREAVDVL